MDSLEDCSQLSIPLTGVSVPCCTPWGKVLVACAAVPPQPVSLLGDKEGRRRKVPTECPMTQLVPEWEGDGWISCEGASRWVMKWHFKTGKNLKGQQGIDFAINSPGLMFHWVAACWLLDGAHWEWCCVVLGIQVQRTFHYPLLISHLTKRGNLILHHVFPWS